MTDEHEGLDDFAEALVAAMLEPVDPEPCCPLSGRFLHHHWSFTPEQLAAAHGEGQGILYLPDEPSFPPPPDEPEP